LDISERDIDNGRIDIDKSISFFLYSSSWRGWRSFLLPWWSRRGSGWRRGV